MTVIAFDPQPGMGTPLSGESLAIQCQTMLKSVAAQRKGSARPSDVQTGEAWLDDAVSPWVLKLWDGTSDIPMLTVDPSAHALAFAGLGIGDTVQAHSSVLDLIAAVTPVSGKVPYFTGSPVSAALASLGAFGLTMLGKASASEALDALGVSAFIKTLLNDADAATARATLAANIMRCGAVVSSTTSKTLGASDLGKHHHTYGSPTLTLPPLSVCENGSMLLISCYSGVTTVLRNGTEGLYTTSSITSFTLNPGDFAILTTPVVNGWIAMICRANNGPEESVGIPTVFNSKTVLEITGLNAGYEYIVRFKRLVPSGNDTNARALLGYGTTPTYISSGYVESSVCYQLDNYAWTGSSGNSYFNCRSIRNFYTSYGGELIFTLRDSGERYARMNAKSVANYGNDIINVRAEDHEGIVDIGSGNTVSAVKFLFSAAMSGRYTISRRAI